MNRWLTGCLLLVSGASAAAEEYAGHAIAARYGYDRWSEVRAPSFTFNVEATLADGTVATPVPLDEPVAPDHVETR